MSNGKKISHWKKPMEFRNVFGYINQRTLSKGYASRIFLYKQSNNGSNMNFESNDNQWIDEILPTFSESAMAQIWNANIFDVFDDLSDGQTDALAGDLSAGVQDLVEDPVQLFDNYDPNLQVNTLAAIPNNSPVPANPPPVEETSTKSSLVESSNPTGTINFINAFQFFLTNLILQLAIPPLAYQRVRYEDESKKVLRYIFVPNNAVLTLTTSSPLSDIAPHVSFFLRITRLMVPYGPHGLRLCHPYPIQLNDENCQVHNGSLFLPVSGQRIELEKLVLIRLLQPALKKMNHFRIFTSDQLDCNDVHTINTRKVKLVIREYQLRYSVLHFQIVCVDANNRVSRTDLQCQSEPMYEYEGKELDQLPPYVRQVEKGSRKRKSIGQLKKSSKKTKMPKKRKEA